MELLRRPALESEGNFYVKEKWKNKIPHQIAGPAKGGNKVDETKCTCKAKFQCERFEAKT